MEPTPPDLFMELVRSSTPYLHHVMLSAAWLIFVSLDPAVGYGALPKRSVSVAICCGGAVAAR
jgi:hypothetical protein